MASPSINWDDFEHQALLVQELLSDPIEVANSQFTSEFEVPTDSSQQEKGSLEDSPLLITKVAVPQALLMLSPEIYLHAEFRKFLDDIMGVSPETNNCENTEETTVNQSQLQVALETPKSLPVVKGHVRRGTYDLDVPSCNLSTLSESENNSVLEEIIKPTPNLLVAATTDTLRNTSFVADDIANQNSIVQSNRVDRLQVSEKYEADNSDQTIPVQIDNTPVQKENIPVQKDIIPVQNSSTVVLKCNSELRLGNVERQNAFIEVQKDNNEALEDITELQKVSTEAQIVEAHKGSDEVQNIQVLKGSDKALKEMTEVQKDNVETHRAVTEVQKVNVETHRAITEVQKVNVETHRAVTEELEDKTVAQKAIQVKEDDVETHRAIIDVQKDDVETHRAITEVLKVNVETHRAITEVQKVNVETHRAINEVQEEYVETHRAIIDVQEDDVETHRAIIEVQTDDVETHRAIIEVQTDDVETHKAIIKVQTDDVETHRAIIDMQINNVETHRGIIEVQTDDVETHRAIIDVQTDDVETHRAITEVHEDKTAAQKALSASDGDLNALKPDRSKLLFRNSSLRRPNSRSSSASVAVSVKPQVPVLKAADIDHMSCLHRTSACDIAEELVAPEIKTAELVKLVVEETSPIHQKREDNDVDVSGKTLESGHTEPSDFKYATSSDCSSDDSSADKQQIPDALPDFSSRTVTSVADPPGKTTGKAAVCPSTVLLKKVPVSKLPLMRPGQMQSKLKRPSSGLASLQSQRAISSVSVKDQGIKRSNAVLPLKPVIKQQMETSDPGQKKTQETTRLLPKLCLRPPSKVSSKVPLDQPKLEAKVCKPEAVKSVQPQKMMGLEGTQPAATKLTFRSSVMKGSPAVLKGKVPVKTDPQMDGSRTVTKRISPMKALFPLDGSRTITKEAQADMSKTVTKAVQPAGSRTVTKNSDVLLSKTPNNHQSLPRTADKFIAPRRLSNVFNKPSSLSYSSKNSSLVSSSHEKEELNSSGFESMGTIDEFGAFKVES
ncbi:hypothetical protein BsWGS_11633 [Bradybaena similaris]